jgi:ribosome maturation factor RimP
MPATKERGRAIPPELKAEFEQIAAAAGCELVHAEFVGGTLRLFLDKPGGVSLGDCEHVSKQVSAYLDVVDFGVGGVGRPGRYVLEVSSPGLDRQLYGPRDYERFAGRLARVTFEDPATGKKQTVVARLEGLRRPQAAPGDIADVADIAAADETAEVVLRDEAKGERRTVPLSNVKLARLEIEL